MRINAYHAIHVSRQSVSKIAIIMPHDSVDRSTSKLEASRTYQSLGRIQLRKNIFRSPHKLLTGKERHNHETNSNNQQLPELITLTGITDGRFIFTHHYGKHAGESPIGPLHPHSNVPWQLRFPRTSNSCVMSPLSLPARGWLLLSLRHSLTAVSGMINMFVANMTNGIDYGVTV